MCGILLFTNVTVILIILVNTKSGMLSLRNEVFASITIKYSTILKHYVMGTGATQHRRQNPWWTCRTEVSKVCPLSYIQYIRVLRWTTMLFHCLISCCLSAFCILLSDLQFPSRISFLLDFLFHFSLECSSLLEIFFLFFRFHHQHYHPILKMSRLNLPGLLRTRLTATEGK